MKVILALIMLVCQETKQGPTAPEHTAPKGMNGDVQR